MTETPIPPATDPGGAPPPAARRSFGERFVAALKLDPTVYEEVEHDRDALGHAAAVVAIAAIAGAIVGATGHGGFLGGLVQSFASWLIWTAIVWIVGVKLLGHTSDFEELLRTLGFVAAPQALVILAIVPIRFWQFLVGIAVLVMTLVAFFRAVRAALDVDTAGAWLAVGLAVLAQLVLVMALAGIGRMF